MLHLSAKQAWLETLIALKTQMRITNTNMNTSVKNSIRKMHNLKKSNGVMKSLIQIYNTQLHNNPFHRKDTSKCTVFQEKTRRKMEHAILNNDR